MMSDLPLEEWLHTTLRGFGPVSSRPMFGTRAYLLRGKLFAALGDAGLLLKLPPEAREPLLQSGDATALTATLGASFGEWVALAPARIAADRERLQSLVRLSFDYAQAAQAAPKPPREERHFRKRQY